jgi:hypothetical protein
MRMVSRLPPSLQAEAVDLYGFQIAGEHAAWWGYDGDIWKVPLSGGEPEQLLPQRRLRVSSWPWAYDESAMSSRFTTAAHARAHCSGHMP